MHLDGSLCDRQSDSGSSAQCITRLFDSKEGIEDSGEHVFGDARSAVADGNVSSIEVVVEVDVNGGLLRGVANRIAQHILDGAAQQLAVAENLSGGGSAQRDAAATNLGFEGAVANDFIEDLCEADAFRALNPGVAL